VQLWRWRRHRRNDERMGAATFIAFCDAKSGIAVVLVCICHDQGRISLAESLRRRGRCAACLLYLKAL